MKTKIKIKTETNIKTGGKSWIFKMLAIAFVISIVFAFISSGILPNVPLWAEGLLLIAFIVVGTIFDAIGVAVSASSQVPFHSMNARQVRGSKRALWLVRNAEKVSNFCNDVIGDICNIITGGAAAIILDTVLSKINMHQSPYLLIITLGCTAIVSIFAIGLKAFGKTIALKHSNQIVYQVALFICFFKKEKHASFAKRKGGSKR